MSLCQTFPTIRLAACGLLLGTTLRMHAQQAASVPALEIAPGVTIPLVPPLAVEPEKMTNWQLLEIAAGHLRSDQDEEAKCRMLAVRSALRRKLAPKAAALVADTPAAFRAEAAAEAAWLLALTDKEDPQCGKWIQDARDHLGHAPEWHSDHARAWLAGVLQLLDKKEESAALLAAIREAREKALARSLLLRQKAPQKEIDAFLAEEGETFIMAQIDLLVALARQKITAGDGEGGKTLARKAGEYALKTKKIHHLSRIGDLAELWIEQGDRAEAALHWKIFEKAAAILAPNDELKPVLLCRAACLAVRAGHQDAARTLVRSAEELIPKIFLLYIPEALVAIAEARLALQEPEKAASMMTSALKAASAHTHERARALGAFRVCLFADENGLSLTAADKQTLKLLLRL